MAIFEDDQLNALRQILEFDLRAIQSGEGRDIAEFLAELDAEESIRVRLSQSPQDAS